MTTVRASLAAAGPAAPGAAKSLAAAERAAVDFESVFISQLLQGMTSGLKGDGPLASAESNPFSSMLQDEYGKIIARNGGVGIAGAVMRELLRTQEVAA